MINFTTFTGDRTKTDEIVHRTSLYKILNIQFRANNTATDAEHLTEVADRFEDGSAEDKWFNDIRSDPARPAAATIDKCDAFCIAFTA